MSKHVIVSGYFVMKSKLHHEQYVEYLTRFFRSCPNIPVVFFTTLDMADHFKPLIKSHVHIVCVPDWQQSLHAFQKWSREFWKYHLDLDPEKAYHSADLAAFWYEKPHFVLKAMNLIPQQDNYVWIDAGCIRDNISEENWSLFGTRLEEVRDDRLHLQCLNEPAERKLFYQHFDKSIAAAIMFGSLQAWEKHISLYDRVLQQYHQANKCGTKDQHIIRSCVDQEENFYKLHHIPHDSVVDEWFFFLEHI